MSASLRPSPRRREANALAETNYRPPPAATIGDHASDETRATKAATSRFRSPSSQPITDEIGAISTRYPGTTADPPQQQAASSRTNTAGQSPPADPIESTQLPPSVLAIYKRQRERRFCIKSQSRCDRSTESFIAMVHGYRSDMPEPERKAIFKQAGQIRLFGEYELAQMQGRTDRKRPPKLPEGDLIREVYEDGVRDIIFQNAQSRSIWDTHRLNVETAMRKLARTLPVYEWAKSIKGFGDLGLAIIVGEAPLIGHYKTEYKLWKRLGVGLVHGPNGYVRQQRRTNVDEAALHAYAPRRRAEVYTLQEPLLFSQWNAAKDEDGNDPKKSGKPIAVPAHAAGPYGQVYADRKARTAITHSDWSDAHRENDARRIMVKALLADLWKQWRKLDG